MKEGSAVCFRRWRKKRQKYVLNICFSFDEVPTEPPAPPSAYYIAENIVDIQWTPPNPFQDVQTNMSLSWWITRAHGKFCALRALVQLFSQYQLFTLSSCQLLITMSRGFFRRAMGRDATSSHNPPWMFPPSYQRLARVGDGLLLSLALAHKHTHIINRVALHTHIINRVALRTKKPQVLFQPWNLPRFSCFMKSTLELVM